MKKLFFIFATVAICAGMTITSCNGKSGSDSNGDSANCEHHDCAEHGHHHDCDGHNHDCAGHNHAHGQECAEHNYEAEAAGSIVEVTNNEFTPKEGVVSVLDFTATWCGPCQQLKPIYKQAAEKYAGKVQFYSIDVDANAKLAEKYRIKSVPTIIVIDAKGNKTENSGLVDLGKLSSMIDAAL